METGVFLVTCLLFLSWSGGTTNSIPVKVTNETLGQLEDQTSSLAGLENALAVLTNLTAAQKEVLEQQKRQEQLLKQKNKEGEERESIRTKALEEEQRILREMKAKINRKIKMLGKKTSNGITNLDYPNQVPPKDCADVYLKFDEDTSDVYRVWPVWKPDGKGILVYCDMETDGGGWTVLHRWGSYGLWWDYYKKPWNEYKIGFGDVASAFWLGNEQIYALTSQGSYNMRLDLETENGREHSVYNTFWIDSEAYKYKMHIDGYDRTKGNAGDFLTISNNTDFMTFDRNAQCTTPAQGRPAWWYPQYCTTLDAKLRPTTTSAPRTNGTTEKKEMKIRPANFLTLKESG